MRSLSTVNSALLLADRHIAQAMRSISQQADQVDQWQDMGGTSQLPRDLLNIMLQTLDAFLIHRTLLVDEINEHQAWHWLKEEASKATITTPID